MTRDEYDELAARDMEVTFHRNPAQGEVYVMVCEVVDPERCSPGERGVAFKFIVAEEMMPLMRGEADDRDDTAAFIRNLVRAARSESGDHREREKLSSDLDEAWARIRKILRMDETYSLGSIVRMLAAQVDHLLADHDCDHIGHEGMRYAVDAAHDWLSDNGYERLTPYASTYASTSDLATRDQENAHIAAALDVINQYGGIDGDHHKKWVLDQVVRALTGDQYDAWVAAHNDGEDGPDTYAWEEGIPP